MSGDRKQKSSSSDSHVGSLTQKRRFCSFSLAAGSEPFDVSITRPMFSPADVRSVELSKIVCRTEKDQAHLHTTNQSQSVVADWRSLCLKRYDRLAGSHYQSSCGFCLLSASSTKSFIFTVILFYL